MDGDTAEIVPDDFALARVDACPDIDAKLLHGLSDGLSTSDCARRTVEGSEKAVTGRVYLTPAMAFDLVPNEPVMLSQKLLPRTVTEFDELLGGFYYVGEEHRRQNSFVVGLCFPPPSSQKGFDLTNDRFRISRPWVVIRSRQFDAP